MFDWTQLVAEPSQSPATANPQPKPAADFDWTGVVAAPELSLTDRAAAAGSYLKQSAIAGMHNVAAAGAKIAAEVVPGVNEAEAIRLSDGDPEKLADIRAANAATPLYEFADEQNALAGEAMRNVSPEAQQQYGSLEYATTDPDKAAYLSPVKVVGDALASAPSTAALAGTAYLTRGAGGSAYRAAITEGATPEAAKQAAIVAAGKTAATVGAASEGALGYAQQSLGTKEQIQNMPFEQLADSDQFIGLLREGFTKEQARDYLAYTAGEQSGIVAGALDAATNAIGGKYLGEIIGDGGKLLPRTAKGIANEAATETVQSGGEQFAENLALQQVDPNIDLSAGVGESMVQGAAVGGLTGGAVAGTFGGTHAVPAEPPAAPATPDAADLQPLGADAAQQAQEPAFDWTAHIVPLMDDAPVPVRPGNPQPVEPVEVDDSDDAGIGGPYSPGALSAFSSVMGDQMTPKPAPEPAFDLSTHSLPEQDEAPVPVRPGNPPEPDPVGADANTGVVSSVGGPYSADALTSFSDVQGADAVPEAEAGYSENNSAAPAAAVSEKAVPVAEKAFPVARKGKKNAEPASLVADVAPADATLTQADAGLIAAPETESSPAAPAVPANSAVSEPAAADEIAEGEYRHAVHSEATVRVTKNDKGYAVEWAPDDVQQFTGKRAAEKTRAALTKEQYTPAPPLNTNSEEISNSAPVTDNEPLSASVKADIDTAAHEAATSPQNDLPEPTQAQKEAGNYKVGRVKVQGLDISIENPKGSIRSGVGPKGRPWQNEMKAHYGYIRRTEGADGDHVDVFVGDNPESNKVFVVDQVNADGSFDEHKVLMGFDNRLQATNIYRRNYQKGWKVGPVTEMTTDEFKGWLRDGDTTKPLKPEEVTPTNEGKTKAPATKAVSSDKANAAHWAEMLSGPREKLLHDIGIKGIFAVRHAEKRWEKLPPELRARIEPKLQTTSVDAAATDTDQAEFIKAPGGGIDFGEISADQAKAIGRQSGKIRLQQGDESFGLTHIEIRHGDEIKAAGFDSVEQFVQTIAEDMNQIWKPEATRQLVAIQKAGNSRMLFIELQPGRDDAGDFYTVKTAFTSRKAERKGWKLLWESRAQLSDSSGENPAFAASPQGTGEGVTNPSRQSKSQPKTATGESLAPDTPKDNTGSADGPLSLRVLDSAKLKNGASPAGLTVEATQRIVDEFLSKFPGADDVSVSVRRTQQGAFGPAGRSLGRVKGAFDHRDNRLILISSHLHNARDALETIQHEILVHKGLGLFSVAAENKIVHALKVHRDEPSLKKAWEYVEKNYADKSHTVRAEEVLAYIAEHKLSLLDRTWTRLLFATRAVLRRFGFLSDNAGMVEFRKLIYDMADAFAQGKRARVRDLDTSYSRTMPPGAPTLPVQSGAGSQNPGNAAWQAEQPGYIDNLIYKLQDRHIDTKRVQEAVTAAGNDIEDAWNPYLKEELFHGRSASRVKEFLDKEMKPMLVQMSLRKLSMPDIEKFLWMRHAEERNEAIAKINPKMPDGGAGVTTAEARAYLAGLTLQQRTNLEFVAAMVDRINAHTRSLMVAYGLESQDTIDAWNSAYKHYVPLQREDDGKQRIGSGFSVRGSSVKRAMGSDKNVIDILANVAAQREQIVVRGEKNRVAQALYGLALKAPKADFWLPVAPQVAGNRTTLADELIALGIDDIDAHSFANEPTTRFIDSRTGLVSSRINPAVRNRDNVLALRHNGKDLFLFFSENDERAQRMSAALKNLDADQLGGIMKAFGAVSRWFAAVNTQYNPIFGGINFMRDAQSAVFNLSTTPLRNHKREVVQHLPAALRGIYSDIRARRAGRQSTSTWAQLYDDFQRAGGQTGYRDMFPSSAARSEAIADELRAMTQNKAMALGKGIFGWLSDYNETAENAVRLAAFKVARDKGISADQAASIAKNLTVNFNRKGQLASQAGALYAFFNASVQGSARLAETIRGPAGKRIIGGGLLLGMLQGAVSSLAGWDDDEPPQFVRERNLLVPLPDGKYIAVPMPLGYHVIVNMGRIPIEWAMAGMRNTSSHLIDMFSLFIGAFNPVGGADLAAAAAPSAADPFLDLALNRDFTGNKIYREDFNSLDPTPGFTRSRDTANIVAQTLAEWSNLASGGTDYSPGKFSPTAEHFEYLIGQITGGVGREVMRATEFADAAVNGDDIPAHKIPVAGKFYGNTHSDSADTNRFYSNVEQMNIHENEILGRAKNGGDVDSYIDENPGSELYLSASKYERAVAKLRKERRATSGDERRQIDADILTLMREFNEEVRAATTDQ